MNERALRRLDGSVTSKRLHDPSVIELTTCCMSSWATASCQQSSSVFVFLVSSLSQQRASGQIGIVDFYVGLTATRHFANRVD